MSSTDKASYTQDIEFLEFLDREFDDVCLNASVEELASFAFGDMKRARRAYREGNLLKIFEPVTSQGFLDFVYSEIKSTLAVAPADEVADFAFGGIDRAIAYFEEKRTGGDSDA